MLAEQNETQYFRVARQAYWYVINESTPPIDGWQKAAREIITSNSTKDKACPRATFIGLCESGDLKSVAGIKQSKSHNYQYAKFAIQAWKKDNTISKMSMWNMIRQHFPDGAINHQGQLDVVIGLWQYIQ